MAEQQDATLYFIAIGPAICYSYIKRGDPMIKRHKQIESDTLDHVANLLCAAARTAPKTRGVDNLEIIIIAGEEKERLMAKMSEIAERDNKPSCKRDADNVKNVERIIVIGTKLETMGLNCGFCGFTTCDGLKKVKGTCAYNSMDLGIALGSASSLAAALCIDNRLMHSIGKAAMECGFFQNDIRQAIGIPLSITGKNPFFDRK